MANYNWTESINRASDKPGEVQGVSSNASLQLVVTMDDSNVNVREFAACLAFMDEVYGRLTHRSLDSYVQRREEQLKLTSIRRGSVELIFSEFIANSEKVTALVVLFFLLKYLPSGVRDMASAYHEYQQGAEVRERRNPLREQVRRDVQLAELDRRKQDQLVQLLDGFYKRERRLLLRTRRFSIEHVHRVTLRLKQESEEQDIDQEKTRQAEAD